ncbi:MULTISPECIES: DUF305 domain-containing protein [Rufibacter]|uniref:Uncharacterized protein (DUF305 family) n=1 Tax=Rufibacter quisquiliarum TaxID=1549639 RepID=A0A839GQL0_9BACT|nr:MULTISPECIES: DUF305 domain-containing protein [Rufibacter]MBA9079099.1 uncharacterized protein (DUF305 family) [Rufibacter quisquiliarum]
MKSNHYKKFLYMLTVSFVIMYAVMFLNVDQVEHVYLSATRVYTTLLMVAPMAVVMLLMMRNMYEDKKLNMIIYASSAVVFVGALFFLRNQVLVADEQYMKAMIPHHSSAIMVSQKANIKDPELKKLADEIIKSQVKEIAEMKAILKRMDEE